MFHILAERVSNDTSIDPEFYAYKNQLLVRDLRRAETKVRVRNCALGIQPPRDRRLNWNI
jgi:hypothetical protein